MSSRSCGVTGQRVPVLEIKDARGWESVRRMAAETRKLRRSTQSRRGPATPVTNALPRRTFPCRKPFVYPFVKNTQGRQAWHSRCLRRRRRNSVNEITGAYAVENG